MTELKEFRPQLWLTELHLEDFDVRGVVIVGSERTVVWDTLSHPRDMEAVAPLVAGKPLTVVYSHADWDHAWGTGGLPSADVVGHAECLSRFSSDAPETLRRKQREQPQAWDGVTLIPPAMTFQDSWRLGLGDLTLRLHYLPGHTLDCIIGFIPEWGILLAGDTIETPLPVVNDDSPVDQWITALQGWAADPRVQTVIPAHGPVGGRKLIERNVVYLQSLRDGTAIETPEALEAFYSETHEANLRYARRPH